MYEGMKRRCGKEPQLYVLVLAASSAGLAGGLAGNFADVVNVRMQQDSASPAAARKNYRNILDGVRRIIREEGTAGLMRGWLPNCVRGATQTAGQLASYDFIKRTLIKYTSLEDGISSQLTASGLAGLIAATMTNPIDVLKTRIMSSSEPQELITLVKTSFQKEGLNWTVRGWLPSFIRIGP